MTPEQRHRAGVWQRFAPGGGDPSCYFAAEGGCLGRMQSAHVISATKLRNLYGRAETRERIKGERLPILEVSLDELLADARNGVPACERHHNLHEGPVLHCLAPAEAYEFAADFALDHLMSNERSAA